MSKDKRRRILVAEELHLVGHDGVSRVIICGENDRGGPYLQLNDAGGRARIQIALNDGTDPVLSILRTDGKVLVGIGSNESSGVGIAVNDQDGNPAIQISVFPDSSRQIDVYARDGTRVAGIP